MVVPCGGPKSLPVHPFNALIFPILRDCLQSVCTSFAPELVGYSAPRDLHRRAAYSICESLFFIHQDVYHDLFVCS